MKSKFGQVALLGLFLVLEKTEAYELRTHSLLTFEAFKRSRLAQSTIETELGLDGFSRSGLGMVYYDAKGSSFASREGKDFDSDRMVKGVDQNSIAGWLMRGAIREDDLSPLGCGIGNFASLVHGHGTSECNPMDDPHGSINRVVNHFYDPVHNRGLTTSLASGAKAVDWALGSADAFGAPNTPLKDRRNHFSVMDARQAMYSALTGQNPDKTLADEEARKAWWATTFRSLGDVLHLVQDMAQPQHTKNEPHAGSILEDYIEKRAAGASFYKIDGVTVTALPALALAGYGIPKFSRYSDYWSTAHRDGLASGQGLADYANRAFFTEGTRPGFAGAYVLPSRQVNDYGREDVIDPRYQATDAKLRFLTSRQGETTVAGRGARMLTESVLTDFSGKAPTYALTRYNLDDQVL